MKIPTWIRSLIESLLCSFGAWHQMPPLPIWTGRNEGKCLAPVTFRDLASLRQEPEERRPEVFLAGIKPRWVRACAAELAEKDREGGVPDTRIAAIDYDELAEREWADGGFAVAYVAVQRSFDEQLDSRVGMLSVALPGAALLLLLVLLGFVANSFNRRGFEQHVAFLQKAFEAQEEHYAKERQLMRALGRLYDENSIDAPEARRRLLDDAAKVFERNVERRGEKPDLMEDDKALADFFTGLGHLSYSDSQGFWFLRRLPIPELEDETLRQSLKSARRSEDLDPEVFSFLAAVYPYDDVDEVEYERLALLHDWANLPDGANEEQTAKHWSRIKRKIGDLADEGILSSRDAQAMITWINGGCSPEDAIDLTKPMEREHGYKLIDLIDYQQCPQVCDRLERCLGRGQVLDIAGCISDQVGMILQREAVGVNAGLLEYLRFRSLLIQADRAQEAVAPLLLKSGPEGSNQIAAKRPEGELPTGGDRCDFIDFASLQEEHATMAALILELEQRKDTYAQFFSPARLGDFEGGLPNLHIFGNEGSLWEWIRDPLAVILQERILDNGVRDLEGKHLKEAFDRFRALWVLDQEYQLLSDEGRERTESLILFTALCDLYWRKLVRDQRNAGLFIKEFVTGKHDLFLTNSTLGSENLRFFRDHFYGKRLDSTSLMLSSSQFDEITRHL